MPIWIHPALRALQEALEAENLIVDLDSVGLTARKAQETAGVITKQVPVQQKRIIRGDVYTAS